MKAHKQYSLLDTTFKYIFDVGPPGTHLYKVKATYYMLAGFAGRHVVGFEDLSIRVFLEFQNKNIVKYSI